MYNLSEKPKYTSSEVSKLPQSELILIMGILSIVAILYNGFPSLIFGIIAIVLGRLRMNDYQKDPYSYTIGSYKNVKAGFITGIIGVALSVIAIIFVILLISTMGALTFFLNQ